MAVKRVGTIDLFKFIFSFMIISYHSARFFAYNNSEICRGGYIAVEFFFIVSGYLLIQRAKNRDKSINMWKETMSTVKHKYVSFFPYLLFAIIIGHIFYHIKSPFLLENLVHDVLYSVNDLFLLQMFGFSGYWVTGISWYLSVLLIGTLIIYPLLLKDSEKYSLYYAPIIVLFIYGTISRLDNTINGPDYIYGLIYKGVLRGIAGLSLGCISYQFAEMLKKHPVHNKMLTLLEGFGYIISLLFMICYKGNDNIDFFIIFVLFISISISFSGSGFMCGELLNNVFNNLGIFSLSLILNHYYIATNISRLFPYLSLNKQLILYYIIVVSVSIINYSLGKRLETFIKRKNF